MGNVGKCLVILGNFRLCWAVFGNFWQFWSILRNFNVFVCEIWVSLRSFNDEWQLLAILHLSILGSVTLFWIIFGNYLANLSKFGVHFLIWVMLGKFAQVFDKSGQFSIIFEIGNLANPKTRTLNPNATLNVVSPRREKGLPEARTCLACPPHSGCNSSVPTQLRLKKPWGSKTYAFGPKAFKCYQLKSHRETFVYVLQGLNN